MMLGEKFTSVRVVGFVLALAGVLMTSIPDLRGSQFGGGAYLAGDLLFLIACAASAFYNTYCKLLIDRNYTELEILVYTSAVASVASIPLFIWVEPLPVDAMLHMDRNALLGILELALIVYGASMLLFFWILKRLDVTQATLSNYALPFFMGILAVMVLHESLTPLVIAGGASFPQHARGYGLRSGDSGMAGSASRGPAGVIRTRPTCRPHGRVHLHA